MLAIARALVAHPKLIIMDEPSLGLAPLFVREIFQIIERINEERSVAILLVEQNANVALSIAHHGYILENGRVVMEGPTEALRENKDIREFYLGLTETCGAASSPHHVIKHGSVGEACRGVDLKLGDDAEILIRSDSVFSGYYRDEAATREAVKDGWLHTGDIGELDHDGHLFVVDRKKDIIITSGGKNISPSEIENKLKCNMYVKEAIVIGDGRKYLTALIQIDYENVGNWAQNNRIPYTTYQSLAVNSDVYALIRDEVERVNDTLANVETIKKFKILEKELDQDDEELTATQKVKRKVINKRFRKEIDELYRGK